MRERLRVSFSRERLDADFALFKTINDTKSINYMDLTFLNSDEVQMLITLAVGFIEYVGYVNYDGKDFNSLHRTDFTSRLVKNGLLTIDKQQKLTDDWFDITEGKPFYD